MTILINFNEDRYPEAAMNFNNQKRAKEKDTGFVMCEINPENSIQFKMLHEIDECDHSNIEAKVIPSQEAKDIYLHVFLGNVQVVNSPCKITIEKSEKHK